jgi:hypothetical protein
VKIRRLRYHEGSNYFKLVQGTPLMIGYMYYCCYLVGCWVVTTCTGCSKTNFLEANLLIFQGAKMLCQVVIIVKIEVLDSNLSPGTHYSHRI